jgi:hypothetical protein
MTWDGSVGGRPAWFGVGTLTALWEGALGGMTLPGWFTLEPLGTHELGGGTATDGRPVLDGGRPVLAGMALGGSWFGGSPAFCTLGGIAPFGIPPLGKPVVGGSTEPGMPDMGGFALEGGRTAPCG